MLECNKHDGIFEFQEKWRQPRASHVMVMVVAVARRICEFRTPIGDE